MKYIQVYTLLLVFGCQISCGQSNPNTPKDSVRLKRANYSEAQLKEADTSKVPMSMTRSVRLARNGDILIASYLGVFRYDGTSFTNLTSKITPTRFSSFWDVLEDRKGNLWFASKDSGVYCYPSAELRAGGKYLPAGQASVRHFTTKDGLASDVVLHMYEDKAGIIWFGGGGLSRYDGKSFQKFTTEDGLPDNGVNTIMEDKTGKLWIGTRGDACVYDGEKFTVFRNKDGDAFYNVWSIIEDQKGNIWFGGSIIKDKKESTLFLETGLWRYNDNTYTKVSDKAANAMMEDSKGNIWTTGDINPPNGEVWALLRYDAKSLYDNVPAVTEIKRGGRMDFLGILEANDGSIWFGSRNGVHRYDGKTVTDFKNKTAQQ